MRLVRRLPCPTKSFYPKRRDKNITIISKLCCSLREAIERWIVMKMNDPKTYYPSKQCWCSSVAIDIDSHGSCVQWSSVGSLTWIIAFARIPMLIMTSTHHIDYFASRRVNKWIWSRESIITFLWSIGYSPHLRINAAYQIGCFIHHGLCRWWRSWVETHSV